MAQMRILFQAFGIFLLIWQDKVLTTSALGSSYNHDSKTVYCWEYQNSVYSEKLRANSATHSGSGKKCPISMTLNTESTEVHTGQRIPITWKVTFNYDTASSVLVWKQVYTALDKKSNKWFQVIHSNIHACEFGTNCDPENSGRNPVDPTANQVGNFSENQIEFKSDELSFSSPGEYSVLVHIILPGEVPTAKRYDFATYARFSVSKSSPTSVPETENGSENNEITIIIIGAIVGVVMLIIISAICCVWKKRQDIKKMETQSAAPTDYVSVQPEVQRAIPSSLLASEIEVGESCHGYNFRQELERNTHGSSSSHELRSHPNQRGIHQAGFHHSAVAANQNRFTQPAKIPLITPARSTNDGYPVGRNTYHANVYVDSYKVDSTPQFSRAASYSSDTTGYLDSYISNSTFQSDTSSYASGYAQSYKSNPFSDSQRSSASYAIDTYGGQLAHQHYHFNQPGNHPGNDRKSSVVNNFPRLSNLANDQRNSDMSVGIDSDEEGEI